MKYEGQWVLQDQGGEPAQWDLEDRSDVTIPWEISWNRSSVSDPVFLDLPASESRQHTHRKNTSGSFDLFHRFKVGLKGVMIRWWDTLLCWFHTYYSQQNTDQQTLQKMFVKDEQRKTKVSGWSVKLAITFFPVPLLYIRLGSASYFVEFTFSLFHYLSAGRCYCCRIFHFINICIYLFISCLYLKFIALCLQNEIHHIVHRHNHTVTSID